MNNDSYSINDKELTFNDNSTLKFDYPIRQSLVLGDILLIRLEPPLKVIYNENVFCVSIAQRNVLWQIKKMKYVSEDCPFVDIYEKANKLFLRNWCHIIYEVNPKTGKILNEERYLW